MVLLAGATDYRSAGGPAGSERDDVVRFRLASVADLCHDGARRRRSAMPPTATPPERPPQAWLMVLWLVCSLVVIGFALFSYVAGWWYKYLE
jgi:hypothetical protein